jgi:hypothetical protein
MIYEFHHLLNCKVVFVLLKEFQGPIEKTVKMAPDVLFAFIFGSSSQK